MTAFSVSLPINDPMAATGVEQSLPFVLSPDVLRTAAQVPTPAVIYDLDAAAETVSQVQQDLQVLPNAELYFAIKANRNPQVLKFLARLGLGADVASLPEFEAAISAGFHPISATAPGFSIAELQDLQNRGAEVDFSSVSQLTQWCENLPPNAIACKVGLRLQYPPSQDNQDKSTSKSLPGSRFGINLKDPRLQDLINRHSLRVVRLHIHGGEPHSALAVCHQFGIIADALKQFPQVETINLGGGWAYLYYLQRAELQRAWRAIAKVIEPINQDRANPLRLIVEPGMLLLLMAGYLVTEVRAVDPLPSQDALVVVNASAWNLMDWTPRWVVAQIPERNGPQVNHAVAGCTCYENDYFVRHHAMPQVELGDLIVFNAAGAYVTSMVRSLHGLPLPAEWVMLQGKLQPNPSLDLQNSSKTQSVTR